MTQVLVILALIVGYYILVGAFEVAKAGFSVVSEWVEKISKMSTKGWFFVGILVLVWIFSESFFLTVFLAVVSLVAYGNALQYSKNKREKLHKKQLEDEEEKRLRDTQKKEELNSFFKTNLPDNLKNVSKKILEAENDIYLRSQKKFTVETPFWVRKTFNTYKSVEDMGNSKEKTAELYVDDLKEILRTTSTGYNWMTIEKELINTVAKYPETAPSNSILKSFYEFPKLELKLNSADYQYNKDKITDIELKKYFKEEILVVKEYNEEKQKLEEKIQKLNNEIEKLNEGKLKEYNIYLSEQNKIIHEEIERFNTYKNNFEIACKEQAKNFSQLVTDFKEAKKEAVIRRLTYIIDTINLPKSIGISWDIDFDPKERIAIIDIRLPDVVHNPPIKQVELKSGLVDKPLSISEKKEVVPNIHPAILLRIAYEIFRNDEFEAIKLLVLNGWIKFDDPKTGQNTKAFTASLMVEKEQIINLNLSKIDPLVAFLNLKGKSAGKLVEIIPITPVMSLDKKDKRFIATTEVLSKLGSETNLASMDWQDFESLIAQLFEKEFAKDGAEVKVTQASRDRGVDAVIFDPDPIRGGKIIVQAKRYANTVDVSAVRDLCAVVKKEGAIKGILVTTSTYGGDAYQFANNEPVTLLNGAELLGLLKKHGYTFRINLEEAKKLNFENKK